jgi:type IV pilus biogenesis protein CpaD/CtpE
MSTFYKLGGLLLATLTAGCSLLPASAPKSDGAFGTTVRHAMAQQTAHPGAGLAPRAGDTFDAQSARSAINKYRDSFKTPPPSFTILGIGGNIGSGQ